MRENCTYGLTRGKMKSGPENVARPFNAYFIFSTLLFRCLCCVTWNVYGAGSLAMEGGTLQLNKHPVVLMFPTLVGSEGPPSSQHVSSRSPPKHLLDTHLSSKTPTLSSSC